jgi:hypothetical protein
MSSSAVAGRPLATRSQLTNRTRLLDGVDGRSSGARRFRDLVESFANDFGGRKRLTETEMALVKQAAAATLRAEQLQAAIAKGEHVDSDEMIRLSGTIRRLLASVTRKEDPKADNLADYIARRAVPA